MRKSSLTKMAILLAILMVSNSCATGIHRCYEGEPRPESEIAKIHIRGFSSYALDGAPCRVIKEVRQYNSPKFYIELLPGKYAITGEIDPGRWRFARPIEPCMEVVTVEAGQVYKFKGFIKVFYRSTHHSTQGYQATYSAGYPTCEFKHKPK